MAEFRGGDDEVEGYWAGGWHVTDLGQSRDAFSVGLNGSLLVCFRKCESMIRNPAEMEKLRTTMTNTI